VGLKFIVMAVCLLSSPVGATEVIGSTAEFLGWERASRHFAYALTTRPRRGNTKTITFMKRAGNFHRAKRMRFKGSVRRLARVKKFVINPLQGQRIANKAQAFVLDTHRTARVVLNVGKKGLTYTVWLDDSRQPGKPTRLIGGVFDELWTSLDAAVYPSPNGRWIAIVLTMRTSFGVLSWVDGVRVGNP